MRGRRRALGCCTVKRAAAAAAAAQTLKSSLAFAARNINIQPDCTELDSPVGGGGGGGRLLPLCPSFMLPLCGIHR